MKETVYYLKHSQTCYAGNLKTSKIQKISLTLQNQSRSVVVRIKLLVMTQKFRPGDIIRSSFHTIRDLEPDSRKL